MHFLAAGVLLVASASTASARVDGLDAVCLSAPYDRASSDEELRLASLVGWAREALEPYASLAAALEKAAPEICLAHGMFGAEGYFSLEANRIVMDTTLPAGLMRAVLIHELRHVHQSRIGMCAAPGLSMDATARLALSLEADASVLSLEVAWGLRQDGDAGVWDALAAWPTHADLTRAFEAEMLRSGEVARAATEAFARWFASDWRRETYYLAACSDYLDRQDRTHALPTYRTLSPEYLDTLCRLSDGQSYSCAVPALED